jgi:hypothetical protein
MESSCGDKELQSLEIVQMTNAKVAQPCSLSEQKLDP